jgi:hypothetical protein
MTQHAPYDSNEARAVSRATNDVRSSPRQSPTCSRSAGLVVYAGPNQSARIRVLGRLLLFAVSASRVAALELAEQVNGCLCRAWLPTSGVTRPVLVPGERPRAPAKRRFHVEAAARRSDRRDRLHGSVAWIGAVSPSLLLLTDAGAARPRSRATRRLDLVQPGSRR